MINNHLVVAAQVAVALDMLVAASIRPHSRDRVRIPHLDIELVDEDPEENEEYAPDLTSDMTVNMLYYLPFLVGCK